MARLIQSSDVFIGSKVRYDTDPIEFYGGRNLGSLPTLYDAKGEFVEPVNQWFVHLAGSKHLENLSSYSRALLRYWSFIEKEQLAWDKFPPVKSLKPTYRFRNDDLLRNTKRGLLAYSTAKTYMSHVVQFYLWAAYERYFEISESHKPFEIEFVQIQSNSMLGHMAPKFIVQTSDLRIKVPRDASSNNVRGLTPLPREMLLVLSQYLTHESPEIRLMVMLGTQCGLRIEEAAGLTIASLAQATPRADAFTHFEMTIGTFNGVPTKYNKTRTIEITKQLLNELRRYSISERRLNRLNKLQKHIATHNSILPTHSDSHSPNYSTIRRDKLDGLLNAERFEPIFITERGNPFHPKVLDARFGELRRGIKQSNSSFSYRFHDLRSSYATYRLHSLLEAGLAPATALDLLMQWMGHNNESTTWKYLAYLKRAEALKDKISMLDEIMHQALHGENYA